MCVGAKPRLQRTHVDRSEPIYELLPDVINLAMGANGEDKSTFLRLMYRE